MPQPLGVVGILVPWNYPLYLAIGPMAAALAAGNRVMVKMSEASPAFASCFQALCAKAFAADEVAGGAGGPAAGPALLTPRCRRPRESPVDRRPAG